MSILLLDDEIQVKQRAEGYTKECDVLEADVSCDGKEEFAERNEKDGDYCCADNDDEDVLEKRFREDSKVKNRTKGDGLGRNGRRWFSLGNSSRPRGMPNACRRLYERKINQDIEQHLIVDYVPSAFAWKNKNPFPIAVAPTAQDNNVRNTNCKRSHRVSKKKKTPEEARAVILGEIHENLYIGNMASTDDDGWMQRTKIRTIINLSESLFHHTSIDMQHFALKDSLAISFREFRDAAEQLTRLIHSASANGKVLVVCNGGVNRAPAMAIAYAMLQHDWTFQRALDYVEERKTKHDATWSNLTNPRFRHCLRAMCSSLRK